MDRISKTLTALLLSMAFGGTASAGEGFIVQPKLWPQPKVESSAEATPNIMAVGNTRPGTHAAPQPISQPGMKVQERLTPQVDKTAAQPLRTPVGERVQPTTSQPSTSQPSTSQLTSGNLDFPHQPAATPKKAGTADEPTTALRWVARDETRERARTDLGNVPPTLNGDTPLAEMSSPQVSHEVLNQAVASDPVTDEKPTPVHRPEVDPTYVPSITGIRQPGAKVETPENKAARRKQEVAKLVSNRILKSPQTPAYRTGSVMPLENPVGWQAVGERLSQHLSACESLLKRNAFFSAREEAIEAMLHLARRLDQAGNRLHCEPAYLAARQAFKEADDFSMSQRLVSDVALLRRIVNSHETPVLKSADLKQLSPMTAAQHYRLYAEQCLHETSQGHPWASEILYAIGRSYQAEADRADRNAETLRLRAVSHYKAAQWILPSNALASNQLGYIMLQMDRPIEAREVLLASVSAAPSPAAFQNLIEAGRRLGDQQTLTWASQNLAGMQAPNRQSPAVPAVVEVDPRMFAAMSPRTIGPAARQAAPPESTVASASYASSDGYR